MGILRAIGFGIALVVLRALMPDVFNGLEHALIEFFTALEKVLTYSTANLGGAGAFPYPTV